MRTTYRYNKTTNEMELVGGNGGPLLTAEERAAAPKAPSIIQDVPPHMFGKTYIGSRPAQRELSKTQGYVPFEVVSEHARALPSHNHSDKSDHWLDYLHSKKAKLAAGAGLTEEGSTIEANARKAAGSRRKKVNPKPIGLAIE